MLAKDFYKRLDVELGKIIDHYAESSAYFKKHKQESNRKSYAFMIWFLQFYAKANGWVSLITDSDEDGSCDLMFPYHNELGEITYCVVQSKWKAENNCEKHLEDKEFLKALRRFETILNGEKEQVNDTVKQRIGELLDHSRRNLPVKFIFLTLCKQTESKKVSDEIRDFQNNYKKTQIEWLDIERLKYDFIDRRYKQIAVKNPCEWSVDADDSTIALEIARFGKNKRDLIHIEKPFESYVFLVKPKAIYELFERFGFGLFFKNIRNPLLASQFNPLIEKSANDNTEFFWYYNNGITAITHDMDELGVNAQVLTINGLQIINGAQTVFAIHKAYSEATTGKRKRMDSDTLITFRLVRANDKDFGLNITRFTNSQNPVSARDFHANDEIQERLQKEFFDKSKVWYEKRNGEFRQLPDNLKVVSNTDFAAAYLLFGLQEPNLYQQNDLENLLFLSNKEHPQGLYERIFYPSVKMKELLGSYYMVYGLSAITNRASDKKSILYRSSVTLMIPLTFALAQTVLKNHLKAQLKSDVPVFDKIIEWFEKGEYYILEGAIGYATHFCLNQLEEDVDLDTKIQYFQRFPIEQNFLDSLKEKLELNPVDLDVYYTELNKR